MASTIRVCFVQGSQKENTQVKCDGHSEFLMNKLKLSKAVGKLRKDGEYAPFFSHKRNARVFRSQPYFSRPGNFVLKTEFF